MAKIDTREWKEFVLQDIFEIKHPRSRSQSQYENGDIPYVSSGAYNNGIAAYLTPKNGEKLDRGNCITVSPLDGSSYWQEDDFLGRGGSGASISMLYNSNLNQYSALFVCAAIKAVSAKYGYDNLLNSNNLKMLKIKLPTTSENLPDYAYMEQYMRSLEDSVSSSLTALQSAQELEKKKIDISNWKEFNMADLGFTNHHGSRIKKADRIDGNTIFLTAGKENCGVVGTIGNKIAIWHNPITIDMFGNTFYHDYDCAGDDNIYALVNDNLTQHVKMFLAAVIAAKNSNQYSYEDQFRQDNVDNLSILLPVTADNKPDWNYMEKYVQFVLSMTTKQISSLPI